MLALDHIILVRNPRGGLLVIQDDGDCPHVFPSEEHAKEWARTSKLCQAWDYQIVEVEI